MKNRIAHSQEQYRENVLRLSAGYAALGREALAKMTPSEIGMLHAEKSVDLRVAARLLRDDPNNELNELRFRVANAAVQDIAAFIKERERGNEIEF